MQNPVVKTTLDNGLTIFLKEIHTAPIISHWVWYRIGSRYETPGKTGISHWVEHMQFKGTHRFPGSKMDQLISREGGIWNAFTHLDWTTYFETMPADKINVAMELEADRMFNSVFDQKEVDSERTVILSEKEGKENEPILRLNTAVVAASFENHPYKHEVIGTTEDLNRINRDDLYQHYRRYYHPGNAHITMAGDFDSHIMIDKLNSLYADKPARDLKPQFIQPEEIIKSKKEILISGPGDTCFVQIAYRAPAANHPDFSAYTILDSLLSGPASLNMFGGGGTTNKTSRLYKSLVEKDLAISIYGGLQATMDPFIYELTITIHPEQKPETVIKALDQEVDRIINRRIRRPVIERAIKQARALFAYGFENITNQAFWLGYSEMFANYEWFTTYLNRLEAIKPADIRYVAEKYLNPENRVVGIYIPTKEPIGETA
ncbi:MAG: peptidase M16 [Anaerolineaceae bacterium]|nr:peptidase M16 [Anaerolineaceae bacterium]